MRLALAWLEVIPPPNFFTVTIQLPGNSYPLSRLSLLLVRGLLDVQGFLYPELEQSIYPGGGGGGHEPVGLILLYMLLGISL